MAIDLKHDRSSTTTSNTCLICNSSSKVSTRNAISIFKHCVSSSDRTIVEVINDVLGIVFSSENVHSSVVCRRCFNCLNEVDELRDRIADIKLELTSRYQRTLKNNFEGLGIHTIDIIDTKHEIDTPKSVEKRGLNQPADIKQKAMIADLENINEDDELDDIIILDSDDSDYERSDGGESSSKKTQKMTKNTREKKTTEILIPQMLINQEGEIYTCLLCSVDNKFTADARGIAFHTKDVHQIKLFICDVCGQGFLKRPELIKHLELHAKVEEVHFVCDRCDLVFTNVQMFTEHQIIHMPQSKIHTCETCGRKFASRNTLEKHNNTHNIIVHQNLCEICGKNFTAKTLLKRHKKIHTNRERNFICINCGKAFLTYKHLMNHRKTHYTCQNYGCYKKFTTRKLLDEHIKNVHTGKPFKYEVCQASFKQSNKLKRHEVIHTGDKPFICDICGKAFNNIDNRNTHRFKHTEKKPYECSVCGAGFWQEPLLYKHMTQTGHLYDTIVANEPPQASIPVTVQKFQDIQMPNTDSEMELAMVVDSDGNQAALCDMTEGERKLFVGEFKEHILLPVKQEDLENDLNSVEQILVDKTVQIQCAKTAQHDDFHTTSNMDSYVDDGDVDVGHVETVIVSVDRQAYHQIIPVTGHITLNESDDAAFAENATINGENVEIVQIKMEDDDGEDQKH